MEHTLAQHRCIEVVEKIVDNRGKLVDAAEAEDYETARVLIEEEQKLYASLLHDKT